MKTKLVSIIVPVYNVEPFLPLVLNSLLNQTYKNIEIIFVNDGSTDNSLQIINNFCKNNPNAKVVSQTNRGLASARNTGYRNATGDLIFFYDSDDVLYNNTIKYLVDALVKNNADVSCCSFKKFKDEKKIKFNIRNNKVRLIYGNDKIAGYLMKSFRFDWMTWNKLYKKNILSKFFTNNKLFNEKFLFGEDVSFFLQYMSKVEIASITNNKMYGYRQRSASLVHQKFSNKKETFIKNISQLDELAANFPRAKYIAYDKFAHQFRKFLVDMVREEYDVKKIKTVFQLYLKYFVLSIKNIRVPWYRKLDLIFCHCWLKTKVKKHLKKH